MRTQWTTKGNRDAGSSCLCDRGLHRYLQSFGGGLNTPNPPLGTPLVTTNPLVFLVEPNSPVGQRTETNNSQGFPPKVTPFSEQQITSLNGCCKAPNSYVIPGEKTTLNSAFFPEIYHSLILSVLRAVRCVTIYCVYIYIYTCIYT